MLENEEEKNQIRETQEVDQCKFIYFIQNSFQTLKKEHILKTHTKQIIVTGFPVSVFIPTRQILNHYTITYTYYQAFDVPLARSCFI